jgi:two-component system, response regulator YesN
MNEVYRVIVAEDERLIARNIAMNIEKAHPSFRVVGLAWDGAMALEMAAELLPHVVFSDIKMPVMDGLALFEALDKRMPDVKKVIISGYDDFQLAREAMQSRTFDYLLKPVNRDELSKTLERLYTQLCSERGAVAVDVSRGRESIVETVECYIRENYAQAVDFSTLASRYGFSGSYLSRIFHSQRAISPQKYLIDYRIRCAKQLLADTRLTIQETGARVGYPDPFHFSKVFKQYTGMNPTQYRNLHTNERKE